MERSEQFNGAPSTNSIGAPIVFTIYCHTHIHSGRRYIGLTKKTMLQRWNQHILDAKKAKTKRSRFVNAIRAYGKDSFSHEILEVCSTLEEANAAEERWITFHDARNPEKGFNLMKGGSHIPHPQSNPWDRPEYREKASAASRKKWQDPEFRVRHADSVKDVYVDPGYRARMSESLKAVAVTPEGMEQRKKASPVGRTLSEEHRARISASSRCKDPEVRAKISEATRAAMADPELQARVRENHAIAMARPEVRAKISARQKGSHRKTHCVRGHDLSLAPLDSRGKRKCSDCSQLREKNRPPRVKKSKET